MEKDFDRWNDHKKQVHARDDVPDYHAREVWWCTLGTNIGFEQDGTGIGHARPVLVLKGFSRNVCVIVPLTTSKKVSHYHWPAGKIEDRVAFAIISQLRLIDTRRLTNKIATMDAMTFKKIRNAVRDIL
jgi:mRNA interferase MazF